jgi:hypothetical protein
VLKYQEMFRPKILQEKVFQKNFILFSEILAASGRVSERARVILNFRELIPMSTTALKFQPRNQSQRLYSAITFRGSYVPVGKQMP